MKNLNEQVNRMKSLMGLITEDTEGKIAVLLDGTSSAGKSYTAKELKAVEFYKATDPNQWVVIDSDHFSGMNNDGEKRRLKLDHPNIRDWAEGNDSGIVSGLYRKDGKDVPENPYEDEYIEGTDPRLWYMAQEFKTGPWKKVIFDDIGNDIGKYVPNIKHKLLIHSPIYIMLGNVGERNKSDDKDHHRDPRTPLDQYLEKYEATTSMPDETIGDPTTVETKGGLKTLLMDKMVDTYPDYNEEYIDRFIDDLGIKDDNTKYWIKVKDGYLSDDQVLINVGSDQQTYIVDIKKDYFSDEKSD
jgi:hypothetical protein